MNKQQAVFIFEPTRLRALTRSLEDANEDKEKTRTHKLRVEVNRELRVGRRLPANVFPSRAAERRSRIADQTDHTSAHSNPRVGE